MSDTIILSHHHCFSLFCFSPVAPAISVGRTPCGAKRMDRRTTTRRPGWLSVAKARAARCCSIVPECCNHVPASRLTAPPGWLCVPDRTVPGVHRPHPQTPAAPAHRPLPMRQPVLPPYASCGVMSACRDSPSERVIEPAMAAARSSVTPRSEASTPSNPRSATTRRIGDTLSVQRAIHRPECRSNFIAAPIVSGVAGSGSRRPRPPDPRPDRG